jgi:pseudouridine-5'-monophosphatase
VPISDTEDLYTLATQQIVCKYGKDYTWDLKTKVMGFVGIDVAIAIVNALELPITPDEYIQAMQEIVGDSFLNSKFLPG